MKKFKLSGLGLCLALFASDAGAVITTWDPQGTTGANPYLGNSSGTWESALWSTSQTGQATPGNWVEATAALFSVHAGFGTPAYTVTMNANHTVAGIFDGPLTPNSATVDITGTGTMFMQSGNLNGFSLRTATDNSQALVTLDVVIAGGSTAGICAEEGGQLFLNAANTYGGGSYLGYSGDSFYGIWNFNNSASFGTGFIYLLNCTGGAL